MTSLAVIFGILCLVHLQDVNAKVKVFHKSLNPSDKVLIFGAESYVDGQLTYALCDNNSEADEIKCTVIREKQTFGNDSYSCNVTLMRDEGHDTDHYPVVNIFSFGENNAVLSNHEVGSQKVHKYIKFTTVQFESCKVGNTQLESKFSPNFPFRDYIIVGHTHSYDVIFSYDQELCGGKSCKATINADGQLINGPAPSPLYVIGYTGSRVIVPLDNGSSTQGYFFVWKIDEGPTYEPILIKADGTEKSLSEPVQPSGLFFPLSAKNNLFGACYQTKSVYNCTQYDFDGNVKLQATIAYGNKSETGGLALLVDAYNLPNGGFYLFSVECEKNPAECFNNDPRLVIDRIDTNGTKTGTLIFEGLRSSNYGFTLFYENETNDTCFSMISNDRKHPLITTNCFTDADFK